MKQEKLTPRIGVGVIIERNGKILLGKRRGSHGDGTWCFPGGHLEFGESWEDCAKREVKEETGLELSSISFISATNDIMDDEKKHYITIFMKGVATGDPLVCEPEKCGEWGWFEWQNLPQPIFLPIQNLREQNPSLFL